MWMKRQKKNPLHCFRGMANRTISLSPSPLDCSPASPLILQLDPRPAEPETPLDKQWTVGGQWFGQWASVYSLLGPPGSKK